jgi:hypothetical protein
VAIAEEREFKRFVMPRDFVARVAGSRIQIRTVWSLLAEASGPGSTVALSRRVPSP